MKLNIENVQDSGYAHHNSTATNFSSDGNQHVLIIGGVCVLFVMLLWVVCCVAVYKKKKVSTIAKQIKNNLQKCRHRNPSENNVVFYNEAQEMIPIPKTEEHPSDPAQERLPP